MYSPNPHYASEKQDRSEMVCSSGGIDHLIGHYEAMTLLL